MNRHWRLNRRWIATTVGLASLGAVTLGCRPQSAEPVAAVPTAAPTLAVAAPAVPAVPAGPPLGAAAVKSVRAGVAVGDQTLDADAEAPLAVDANLVVTERGMAVVTWPEGARVEALGAGVALLPANGLRQLGVRQASGTARYMLPAAPADGPIALNVETAQGQVSATGLADVIVSLDRAPADSPSKPSTLWVIVVDGAVEISAAQPVASLAGAASPLKAVLSAGQAIALGASDASPLAMPVDLAGVETWYGGLLAGDGPPSAANAAFRCQVVAATTTLRDQPKAGAVTVDKTVPLAKGAFIDVRGRTKDGAWLQALLAASELTGWVPATDLRCIAPAATLAVVDPSTVHNVDRAALAAQAPAVATFVQDKTEVAPGGCAKLNWDVAAGTQVTIEGQAVPGKGYKVMCPSETTSYTLAWIDESGKPQTRRLTVTVSAALASAAVLDNRTSGGSTVGGPTPVPTVCVGPECEIVLPTPQPTATRRLRPTPVPVVPTDAPPPVATDAPPPILPTDPPPAEPTQAPTDVPATPTATSEPSTPETPPPAETPTPPDPTPTPSPTPEPTGTP